MGKVIFENKNNVGNININTQAYANGIYNCAIIVDGINIKNIKLSK
jgi:hypothetical protein